MDFQDPFRLEPLDGPSKRRRRLRLGIDRFVRDILSDDQLALRNVHLVALTTTEADPWVAHGAMRALYHQLHELAVGQHRLNPSHTIKDSAPRRGATPVESVIHNQRLSPSSASSFRYFWWAEFQERGAIHFHMIWVNPPFRRARDSRSWLVRHWGLARIYPDVKVRAPSWFRERAGAYVASYAKKDGPKATQQDYSLMPKGWHTFACTRLSWSIAEHMQHEPQLITVNTAEPFAPWYVKVTETWAYGIDSHAPGEHGCCLPGVTKRPRRVSRRLGPRRAATGGAAESRARLSVTPPVKARHRPAATTIETPSHVGTGAAPSSPLISILRTAESPSGEVDQDRPLGLTLRKGRDLCAQPSDGS